MKKSKNTTKQTSQNNKINTTSRDQGGYRQQRGKQMTFFFCVGCIMSKNEIIEKDIEKEKS